MLGAGQHVHHHVLVDLAVELLHDGPDPELEAGDDGHPVEDGHGGDHGENDEPEPEKDEDLLVDDVEGKDAEAVVLGHGARGTVHVEGALGHLREHRVHWVGSDLRVHRSHLDNLCPVGGELVAEEPVGEVDLADHVDQGQQLAEEEVEGVASVCPQVLLEISLDAHHLGNPFLLLTSCLDCLIPFTNHCCKNLFTLGGGCQDRCFLQKHGL